MKYIKYILASIKNAHNQFPDYLEDEKWATEALARAKEIKYKSSYAHAKDFQKKHKDLYKSMKSLNLSSFKEQK